MPENIFSMSSIQVDATNITHRSLVHLQIVSSWYLVTNITHRPLVHLQMMAPGATLFYWLTNAKQMVVFSHLQLVAKRLETLAAFEDNSTRLPKDALYPPPPIVVFSQK